ncbi:hypothetical protein Fot_37838 [Forsythia ovata]|uniref:Uncharacterized protein n=1 Tax=Forsythia ovata TaxID=205694 RepID=A0ABD1S049_9LAMI
MAMRGSLNQRSAPSACQLDDELMSSANATAVVQRKIREMYLEVLRLAYDIPASVTLYAPQPLPPRSPPMPLPPPARPTIPSSSAVVASAEEIHPSSNRDLALYTSQKDRV